MAALFCLLAFCFRHTVLAFVIVYGILVFDYVQSTLFTSQAQVYIFLENLIAYPYFYPAIVPRTLSMLGCLAALFVFLYLAADRLDTLKGVNAMRLRKLFHQYGLCLLAVVPFLIPIVRSFASDAETSTMGAYLAACFMGVLGGGVSPGNGSVPAVYAVCAVPDFAVSLFRDVSRGLRDELRLRRHAQPQHPAMVFREDRGRCFCRFFCPFS